MSPLLFVLCVDYLTRIFTYIGEMQEFKFFSGCAHLRNNLCIVDDLILFCKGEAKSAYLLLQGLKLFTESCGLQANNGKYALYSSAMDEAEVTRVAQFSSFRRGQLPFQYLGVPISTKKMSVADCNRLIEKMTSRIMSSSSRNLSFAGRAQLVNSVLLSIHSYWAQIFLFSKMVIQQINDLCRLYLWSRNVMGGRIGHVNWENVCTQKKYGGLV